jgi:hypothetical protein
MKKSELKNIIKKSIKELMKEAAHTTPCPQGTARLRMTPCPIGSSHNYHFTTSCITIDGQQPTQANIGSIIGISSRLKFKILEIIPTGNPANNTIIHNLLTTTCNSTGPTGCDPNAPFPPNFNLQNWTSMWTSLPNFSSSNPNQPCNFICQRRNQWTSQLNAGGMGPKQTNALACKLAEADNQYQIHNCANSSANNCP